MRARACVMPTYPVDPIFSAGVPPFLFYFDFFFLSFSRGGGSNLIRIHVKSEAAAAVARYNNAQR